MIPESLLSDLPRLEKLLEEYGLDQEFEINDYGNWLPSHSRCNSKKGTILFKPALLCFLSIANSKVESARMEEERSVRNLRADKLLASLDIAIGEGLISKSDVQFIVFNSELGREGSIVVTFGLLIETVLASDQVPDQMLADHAALCDWLENDLIRQLQSFVSSAFFYTEASERNGETLSVRLGFVDFDEEELAQFDSPWWEILQIVFYSDLYSG